ncbi:unnamed protein product [Miscanthus lutarioriparius]|uniref:Retrotransposon gag domain-containing protein n=1 Tax=Miscanthus lutarioriparius TaxID=422564 RepID=A0A811RHP4_9POAL|nr:unnamed protein product [Miscanthus lutarioriparius]
MAATMQQELETLRQAANAGAVTAATVGAATSTVPATGAIPTGVPQTALPDKMDVFEVAYGDRVRYGTQLLKGEAQIWWRGMQTSHSSAPGSLTWHVLAREFERRFYPTTFLEKMKIDLQTYRQDKKTVAEYEVGFNKIVRSVPHVARNEVEKAS